MIRWFLFLFCKDVPRKDSFNATQQYVQKILNNCLIEFLKELVRNLILLLSVFFFCKCQPILLFFGPFFNFRSHPISSLPFITELKIQFFIYFRKNNPVLLLNTFIIPFVSFLIYLFILFLAVLALHCCMWASSNFRKQGLLFIEVHRLLIVGAPLVKQHGFGGCQLPQL